MWWSLGPWDLLENDLHFFLPQVSVVGTGDFDVFVLVVVAVVVVVGTGV